MKRPDVLRFHVSCLIASICREHVSSLGRETPLCIRQHRFIMLTSFVCQGYTIPWEDTAIQTSIQQDESSFGGFSAKAKLVDFSAALRDGLGARDTNSANKQSGAVGCEDWMDRGSPDCASQDGSRDFFCDSLTYFLTFTEHDRRASHNDRGGAGFGRGASIQVIVQIQGRIQVSTR